MRFLTKAFGILVFTNLIALSSTVLGQEQYTITPSLSVSETYDDNIFLDTKGNEISDYITTVTPGIALDLQTQRHWLQLSYAPSIVEYRDTSENDTVRHFGSITYHQDISQHWKLDLTDTYLKSEEPLETTPGVEGVRRDRVDRVRNPYQRNIGEGKLSYLFGPENMLSGGYRNNLLVNEDITVDDGTYHEPFVDYVHWFDKKHGMGLSYRYTIATFTSDDPTRLPQPDFTGHNPELRYLRRFDPQTSAYASYNYASRDFDQNNFRRDYTVHTGTVGVDKNFSPQTNLNATLGFFYQDTDALGRLESDSESGPNFSVFLRKTYQRGSFVVGGAGGWDEQYLEAENRGFVEFWSVEASGQYALLEPLTGYAAAIYRDETYENGDGSSTWRGSVGLRWAFQRYFALALDYAHVDRTSDNPFDEYDTNRVMLILSWIRPIRW